MLPLGFWLLLCGKDDTGLLEAELMKAPSQSAELILLLADAASHQVHMNHFLTITARL